MLAAYIRNLREIRASGQAVSETSYYGTLETLLNDVGETLKPKVRAVINLANRGAGRWWSATTRRMSARR